MVRTRTLPGQLDYPNHYTNVRTEQIVYEELACLTRFLDRPD